MKTVIAYDPAHRTRLKDAAIRHLLCVRHYPLWAHFKEGDPRVDSFPQQLHVPELEVTETLKKRFQAAFAEVGLPVLFVPV